MKYAGLLLLLVAGTAFGQSDYSAIWGVSRFSKSAASTTWAMRPRPRSTRATRRSRERIPTAKPRKAAEADIS